MSPVCVVIYQNVVIRLAVVALGWNCECLFAICHSDDRTGSEGASLVTSFNVKCVAFTRRYERPMCYASEIG